MKGLIIMRVITGSARGVKLISPKGDDTRPTTDRVKESIFNIIQFDVPGRTVLDLFSGTGQLAIEALSRGAERAVLVEQSREMLKIIGENLKKTGFTEKAKVINGDAGSYLNSCNEKFGLIFLDPPYKSKLLEKSLQRISEFDILLSGGIIICERPIDGKLFEFSGNQWSIRDYRYGKTVITAIRRGPSEE